jgi:hypothetical protein
LFLAADTALAQNAQVVGTIKDESGAVIPGATVTARNSETGLVRSAVSDEHGTYRVQALPPGIYSVVIELAGFQTETQERLVLAIDQSASINVVLKPASINETVTVAADTPLVDTTQSTVATSVTNQQIQDLPVASRRWIDLAMLTPGVSQDNAILLPRQRQHRCRHPRVPNGFMVDGVNNTWAQMGEPRQNFAMDSIREFKVSSSTSRRSSASRPVAC